MLSSSTPMPVDVNELQRLSIIALTSANTAERQHATEALRFLSAFEQWENLQQLLHIIHDPHTIFILLKAVQFVVNNEIGPTERTKIQEVVLHYSALRGDHLPQYLHGLLFSIYGSALYLNWRLMVLTIEDENDNHTSTSRGSGNNRSLLSIGEQVEAALVKYLTSNRTLHCMREILYVFSREDNRASQISSIRFSFAKNVLPFFFKFAQKHLDEAPSALELCCLALESVPSSFFNPLVNVQLTTEESINLTPSEEWLPTVHACVCRCGQYLLNQQQPDGSFAAMDEELARNCERLLRAASCITVSDILRSNLSIELLGGLVTEIANISFRLLDAFLRWSRPPISPASSGRSISLDASGSSVVLLETACHILSNVLERQEHTVCAMLQCEADVVEKWAQASAVIFSLWDDEHQDLRSSLLHLVFLFAIKTIPERASSVLGEAERKERLVSWIRGICVGYLDVVLERAALAEDSHEIRSSEGVALHTEKILQPISELMFAEEVDFTPTVVQRLDQLVQLYELCLRHRQHDGSMSEEEIVSLMVLGIGTCVSDAEDVGLVITNVVLSRLSMIINIVALSMRCGAARQLENTLVLKVASFASRLISAEDNVIDMLLACASFGTSSQPPARKLHLGILRSLFFFCMQITETDAGRSRAASELFAGLIGYVLQQHSSCITLVNDANMLMTVLVSARSTQYHFATSEKMVQVLNSAIDGNVAILSHNMCSTSGDARVERSRLLTNLAAFVEHRQLAVPYYEKKLPLFERLLAVAVAPFLSAADGGGVGPSVEIVGMATRDVKALVMGMARESSLDMMILWLVNACAGGMTQLIKDSGDLRLQCDFLSLWAVLCRKAFAMLKCDNVRSERWELASLIFNSSKYVLTGLRERGHVLPHDASSAGHTLESLVYDVCECIACVFSGTWVNVGVMVYYGDDAVSCTLELAVDALVATSVELLMSEEDRAVQVFKAIEICLKYVDDSGSCPLSSARLHVLLAETVYARLLLCMHRCVEYSYSRPALLCLQLVLLNTPPRIVHASVCENLTRNVCSLLVTAQLSNDSIEMIFQILRVCQMLHPSTAVRVLEEMLEYCTAYHRVRLRTVLMMLRNPTSGDMTKSFVSVFGTSSKVATLAAW